MDARAGTTLRTPASTSCTPRRRRRWPTPRTRCAPSATATAQAYLRGRSPAGRRCATSSDVHGARGRAVARTARPTRPRTTSSAATAAEAGADGHCGCARSAREVDRRPSELGRPRGGAVPAGAGDPQPREHVAVPGARRRLADHGRRPCRRCRRSSRCGSSRPRRPSGRASPRRSTTGRPRRSRTRSSRSSTSSGSSNRTRRLARTELRVPARAAPPRAGRRAHASSASSGRRCSTSWASTASIRDTVDHAGRAHRAAHRDRTWRRRPAASTERRPDGRAARRPGSAAECAQARGRRRTWWSRRRWTMDNGCWRSGTMVGASTPGRWRPAAAATSASSSCASGPS